MASPPALGYSSRSYPPDNFSSRLSRPGYDGALVQIVDLAALRASLPVFFQWAGSQQNVGVRVAGVAVMDGKISAHFFVREIIFHKALHAEKSAINQVYWRLVRKKILQLSLNMQTKLTRGSGENTIG